MKTRFAVIIIITAILISSCKDEFLFKSSKDNSSKISDKNFSCKAILIDLEKFEAAITEGFSIDSAYIQNDTLKVTVNYSGGCGDVDFNLVTHGYFMESYPVQLNVVLDITDNDPCEAFIQSELCFDLLPLADSYKQSYQSNGGSIIIHLGKYDNALIYSF